MMPVAVILLAWLAAPLASAPATAEAKLKANAWTTRREGFYQVMRLPDQKRTAGMNAALIQALERENALLAGSANLGEEFSAYYSALIEAVAAMRDPGAAGALLGALGTGKLALDGLAALGEPAVEPALDMLKSTAGRRRLRNLCTLLRRLEALESGLSPEARRRIGEALGACDHP